MQKASKTWTWLFAVTLVLLCTGAGTRLLHRTGGEAVWPLENGLRWFWRGAYTRARALWRAQEAVSRIRQLEDEVEQLRLDARILEDLAAENNELRTSLGLPTTTLRRPLRCEALSWGGALGWWRSLKINRGVADGVRVGDAVVCADGLVGRVRAVYSRAADVQLITDQNSRISCTLALPAGEPAVRGVLKGAGWAKGTRDRARESGQEAAPSDMGVALSEIEALPFLFTAQPLRLEYIGRAAFDEGLLASRTRIVTSGLSGDIPGGIPVGWLISARLESDGLYGVGEVLPAVDFAALRTMAVLIGEGGVAQ
ncbi:MAG: rod shape-determining protein MreC [Kiritimatiellae bacterium]|nr:rod shape-determining protein MreC [Kiritimatiellia bacterium]